MIKYGVFWICADCGEPVGTLEMCEEVGYNFGIDGHFKSDREAAEKEFALFLSEIAKDNNRKKKQDFYRANCKVFEIGFLVDNTKQYNHN